ncbi:MAG: Vitamin B12 transporter BtuB [Alphaproteobacteria bacterium]|nr:MAG: Vitamin B12 transporter BtuB [Alphaproteobacteria bacterium]
MKKQLTIGLLAALTLTSPVGAEEVDEIVVSATGIPTPISQIGASVDVITAGDLERQQITYLQDALATVAGVSTYQSGGPGSTSNVFLRGMTSKYSGVYIDGVQINDPASQQAAWAYLPTHGLESVEVLRGSQGVLYGSEAIGGAISLFTAHGGETTNQAVLESGSFGSESLSFSSRGESGKVGYGLFVKQTDTDGISAASESNGNTEDDGYESLSARGRAVINLSDQVSVDIALRSVSSEIETDASGPSDNNQNYTDFDAVGGKLGLTYEAGNTIHSFAVGISEDETTAYTLPFMSTSLSGLASKGERQVANYRGLFDLSEEVKVIIGIENETEEYTSEAGTSKAENTAVFSLLQYADANGLSISVAARQDDNEVFGRFDTSRISGRKLFGVLGVRASYGTGFRAPSLTEMFGLSDYCVNRLCGNDTLQPEESRSRDFALLIEPTANWNVELAHFKIRVNNFIEYGSVAPDPSDDCLNYNFNGLCGRYQPSDGEIDNSGYEFRTKLSVNEKTNVSVNFTKLDALRANGQRDIRRPEETLNMSVSYQQSERLNIGVAAQVIRDVIDDDFSDWPNTVVVNLEDYELVKLHALYSYSPSGNVFARIENVLDEDYETALGYGTPGRAFYVGVSSSF